MKCINCGKEFVRCLSDKIKKSHYCSDKCYHQDYCKKYYNKNHEEQKKRVLLNYFKYRESEKGLKGIRDRNYKANSKRRFGVENRKDIVEFFGGKCVYCGISEDRMIVHHIDHVGRNTKTPHNNKENLVLCCMGCHSKIHFWHQKLIPLVSFKNR